MRFLPIAVLSVLAVAGCQPAKEKPYVYEPEAGVVVKTNDPKAMAKAGVPGAAVPALVSGVGAEKSFKPVDGSKVVDSVVSSDGTTLYWAEYNDGGWSIGTQDLATGKAVISPNVRGLFFESRFFERNGKMSFIGVTMWRQKRFVVAVEKDATTKGRDEIRLDMDYDAKTWPERTSKARQSIQGVWTRLFVSDDLPTNKEIPPGTPRVAADAPTAGAWRGYHIISEMAFFPFLAFNSDFSLVVEGREPLLMYRTGAPDTAPTNLTDILVDSGKLPAGTEFKPISGEFSGTGLTVAGRQGKDGEGIPMVAKFDLSSGVPVFVSFEKGSFFRKAPKV